MSDDPMVFEGKPCTVLRSRGGTVRILVNGKERTVDASRVKPAKVARVCARATLTIGTPPRAGKMHALETLVAETTGAVLVRASELRAVPKEKPWRSSAYRDYVRAHPCCVCGARNGVQASHHGPHGIATKPGDERAVPLCATCHLGEYHQHGTFPGRTREETDAHVERVALDLVVPWLIDKGLVVESLRALATPLREGTA